MGDNTVSRIAKAIIDSGTEPWQARAACSANPALMDATRSPEVWDGLSVCLSCPVITQCQRWANEETDYVGIAGGRVYTTKRTQRTSLIFGLDTEDLATETRPNTKKRAG